MSFHQSLPSVASMEFSFLGRDLKAPPLRDPLPIQSLFSGPSLMSQGGFPSVFPVLPNTEEILNPNVGPGEDILRKIERERIRLEIMSSELTRKLMMEREMALRRSLGERSFLDEQVATGLNHRPNLTLPPYDNPNPKPEPNANKNKVIMLEKPNPDTYREKRKAVTQDVNGDSDGGGGTEPAPVDVKKKLKNEWSCTICSVSVTSERALDEHFQGKKHKARDSAQKKIKIGMSTSASPSPSSSTSKNAEQSLKPTETIVAAAIAASDMQAKADYVQAQPEVTKLGTDQTVVVVEKHVEEVKTEDEEVVEKVQITQGSGKKNGKKNGTEAGQLVRTIPDDADAVNKKRFKLWCDLCKVGSCSVAVMNNHKMGKKHTNRVKRFRESNDESVPLLTKDADGKPSSAA